MKTILAVLLCVSFNCFAGEWRAADSYREATYLTFLAVDWAQTRNISRNYQSCIRSSEPYRCSERNLILGKSPSLPEVDKYFVAAAALQFAVAYYLPAEYRKALQYVAIGIEVGAVTNNFSIGISAKF